MKPDENMYMPIEPLINQLKLLTKAAERQQEDMKNVEEASMQDLQRLVDL